MTTFSSNLCGVQTSQKQPWKYINKTNLIWLCIKVQNYTDDKLWRKCAFKVSSLVLFYTQQRQSCNFLTIFVVGWFKSENNEIRSNNNHAMIFRLCPGETESQNVLRATCLPHTNSLCANRQLRARFISKMRQRFLQISQW